jgi:hypothetical protein
LPPAIGAALVPTLATTAMVRTIREFMLRLLLDVDTNERLRSRGMERLTVDEDGTVEGHDPRGNRNQRNSSRYHDPKNKAPCKT